MHYSWFEAIVLFLAMVFFFLAAIYEYAIIGFVICFLLFMVSL
jgi:hypothetical protein